jgi:lipoprotein-releasing system permease protein
MYFRFAWRYFKAKKSTQAINIISWVSILAILVGTACLIMVLSVFNGLEGLVKSLYSSFYTDLKIGPASGKTLVLTPAQLQQLQHFPEVHAYSLVVEDQALLQCGDRQSPMVYLKGVGNNYSQVSGLPSKLLSGKFELGSADQPGAVLGAGIENALGIEADRSILPITAYLFKKGTGLNAADPMSSVSTANLAPSGKFAIQEEFDNAYVITNLEFMKRMLGLGPNEYTGVEIAIRDNLQAESVKAQLQRVFGSGYRVISRYEQNRSLYGVMTMEKWVIYAILTLILAVAAFNMVGALTMLVLEKQKDIEVLKALGADDRSVQKIFLSEGILLAFLGGGAGMLIALLACWLQVRYKLVPLEGNSFLIDYYPVKLVGSDFVLVFGTVLVVALLASWFPSRQAARHPIELRS